MNNIQHSTFNVQHPSWARSIHRGTLRVERLLLNVSKGILILVIRIYQLTISPLQTYLFGATGGCRYTPSCSAYAMDAVREHGALSGGILATKRICRCHPWGSCGHDPVPLKNPISEARNSNII